jgi:uncharacterized integral membrane protein
MPAGSAAVRWASAGHASQEKHMSMQRIVGIVLIVVGVILLIMGMNATDSVGDRMSKFFTGQFTDTTVWYIVGGAAAAVLGLLLTVVGGKRIRA